VAWLAIVAGIIALLSEALTNSLSDFAESTGVPRAFVSAIMLPIAGNAAEHASAIIFAMKNRLDVSIGVAIGSSTQIALFGKQAIRKPCLCVPLCKCALHFMLQ
jgi:Ca2+:H+ antiporter